MLERFSPAVRAWFRTTFAAPTEAQAQGWPAIADGHHTLILAPTGSGKTLAAFLWAIDRLMTNGAEPREARTRPWSTCRRCGRSRGRRPQPALPRCAGSGWRPERLGVEGSTRPTVGVRTGRHAAQTERQRMLQGTPPDILITTPESLFLLLTSRARETLRNVEYAELGRRSTHAMAARKRGSHLALSLERLEEEVLRGGTEAFGHTVPDAGSDGVPRRAPQRIARPPRSGRSTGYRHLPGRLQAPSSRTRGRRGVRADASPAPAIVDAGMPQQLDLEVVIPARGHVSHLLHSSSPNPAYGPACVDRQPDPQEHLAVNSPAVCSTWCLNTAPPWCSSTPGGWPNGWPPSSTSCTPRVCVRRAAARGR